MLKITQAEIAKAGGFLGAVASVSAEYLNGVLKPYIKWKSTDNPDRFIVHKAPHLDEYVGELLFRSALTSPNRRRQFMEMALHSDDDTTARLYWPTSAVFGLGADLQCSSYALHLFDEHFRQGGRKAESCAALVVDRCFTALPPTVHRIVDEVNIIDSVAGAHELHLNNILKTAHQVLYAFGKNQNGRRTSGKLDDSWKRAVVDGILAAVVYALENNLDIESPDSMKSHTLMLLDRYLASCPFSQAAHYDRTMQRLRSNCSNVQVLNERATVSRNGNKLSQVLLIHKISSAACQVWGPEIAFFLVVHFWESELLKGLHYSRVYDLIEKSFEHRPPVPKHGTDCSIYPVIVTDKKFTGARAQGGTNRPAQYPSNLWILGCRHGNATLQPNKAMTRFVTDHNFGIGLILLENTREGTKVLFKGRFLPDDFWDSVVDAIQAGEPGLWFRPNDTAPFVVNGSQAHRYVDLSSLTTRELAKICRSI